MNEMKEMKRKMKMCASIPGFVESPPPRNQQPTALGFAEVIKLLYRARESWDGTFWKLGDRRGKGVGSNLTVLRIDFAS